MNDRTNKKIFSQGAKDSLPIAVGYFSVSFTFGILAAGLGLSPQAAGMISLLNVTSAGQFAGLTLIAGGGTYTELFLTQLIINLRYALMSLSLTQKLADDMTTSRRMIASFGITDEIFAVASSKKEPVRFSYLLGLESIPILSWTAGAAVGAAANDFLPASVLSALSVALYAMFVAIVVPPMRESRGALVVALIALVISCLLYYLPFLSFVSSGFSIIICTLIAAGAGAFLFPMEDV